MSLHLAAPATRVSTSASRPQEHQVMQIELQSAPSIRGDRIHYHLLYGAAYPFFLAAEALTRLSARAHHDERASMSPMRSAFAEARENTLVAISYAVMARSTLRTSARHNRSER